MPRPLLLVLALGLFALAPPAQAQSFPSGTVRIIVPFPAGGATDVLGRVLSVHLQNLWGPPVVSEYRPGAAGLLGTRQVASSPADGYTLLMASTGAILALAGDRAGAGSFDITRDLAPISLIAAPPYILVVNPSVPAKTAGRADRLRQAEPGQALVRLLGRGLGIASLRRAVRADGRHRHAARALSRHRPGRHRPARRPHRHDVLARAGRSRRTSRPARCA